MRRKVHNEGHRSVCAMSRDIKLRLPRGWTHARTLSFVDAVAKVGVLHDAYRAFSQRRVDDLLAMLAPDVEWPDVAGGTVLRSHDAVRAYWLAQFEAASPVVEPTDFVAVGDDLVAVVRQQVFDHAGVPLTEAVTVFHRYAFREEKVAAMTVHVDRTSALA